MKFGPDGEDSSKDIDFEKLGVSLCRGADCIVLIDNY